MTSERQPRTQHRSVADQAGKRDVALEIACGARLVAVVTWGGYGGLWLDTTDGTMPLQRLEQAGALIVSCRCRKAQHALDAAKLADVMPRSGRRRVSVVRVQRSALR